MSRSGQKPGDGVAETYPGLKAGVSWGPGAVERPLTWTWWTRTSGYASKKEGSGFPWLDFRTGSCTLNHKEQLILRFNWIWLLFRRAGIGSGIEKFFRKGNSLSRTVLTQKTKLRDPILEIFFKVLKRIRSLAKNFFLKYSIETDLSLCLSFARFC